MEVEEFLSKVAAHPALELEHRDSTMLIIRLGGEGGRAIRIGLWALRRLRWERFARAWGIPKLGQASAAATAKRSAAPKRS